ncbi:MAG: mechanosensitive ion channel [candidate division Zixibacteria bacterium]|nr:mechanosensitive ion channel [candidate division Zixibacteria bacterium]
MEEILVKLKEYVAMYGMRIIGAVLLLIIGRVVIGVLTKAVKNLFTRSNVDETLAKFLTSMVKIALMTFLVVAILGTIGVQTFSLVAVIGAAGLAIGFALQGTLSNFAAGVMLILFRPYRTGDYIMAGGEAGTVEEIQIFNTIMKSPDNRQIVIPNSQITSGSITNFSAKETRRIDLVFGIGYGDDIKKAKELMEKILAEDERVLKDPAPTVAVLELADSSVNFVFRPWVKTADYWSVYFDMTEKVKLEFDKNGISIPFPQRDIHVFEEKAA